MSRSRSGRSRPGALRRRRGARITLAVAVGVVIGVLLIVAVGEVIGVVAGVVTARTVTLVARPR